MILSLCICIVSFIALIIMLGYQMYSKAEVEREIKHAEVVIVQTTKYIIYSIRKIDRAALQRFYHRLLQRIEGWAHVIVSWTKEILPFRQK